MTEVKIIADSINCYTGVRLTTFQLKYWRAIHSEVMTHRMFSRNASSSRAIPTRKLISQVWKKPAQPISWGKNVSGMQAKEILTIPERALAKFIWNMTGRFVCVASWIALKTVNPHKQIINRMLEPWQNISVILTATDFDNFFKLRIHKDAQPEIYDLADKMRYELEMSVPRETNHHIPYLYEDEYELLSIPEKFAISCARCARVSYMTHDGKRPTLDEDMKLHNRLVKSEPMHASPAEHQAIAQREDKYFANFRSWKQYRSYLELNEPVGF